jgi:N-hydroxyarylamine O-acetyltransferase
MELKNYLERIHYNGDLTPNLATLNALQRAHLMAIPYENLDIHRNYPMTTDVAQIYEKIVNGHRGGWCFEMNGLFGWALREAGFDVTLMSSYVGRDVVTDRGAGDHLIMRVMLDKPYLADVGFGNGFREPLPLKEGVYPQGYLTYALSQKEDRWWFQNHIYGGFGYDFDLKPYQLSDFTGQSTRLQTSPDSGFVRATVCMRFTPEGYMALRGAVLRTVTAAGEADETINNEARYEQILSEQFDLHLLDVSELWEKVWARHQVWVKENGG